MGKRNFHNRRGRSQNRNGSGNKGGNNNNRPTQREHKFATLNTGNVSRYHPFETVKQKLVSKLQADKDMVKVAKAIDDMKEIDFTNTKPTRTLSTIDVFVEVKEGDVKVQKKDPKMVDKREIEQEGLDVEWKLEMDEWYEQKRKYEDGMIAASAMIMNGLLVLATFCSSGSISCRLETFFSKIRM